MRPNTALTNTRVTSAAPHRLSSVAHRQSGFVLVSAMFLVAIIGAAVIYMERLVTTQQGMIIESIQSERALQAAYSGLEWAAYQININDSCEASSTFSLSEEDLAGFDLTVTCTQTSFSEGPDTVDLYELVSSAESGVASDTATDPGYAFRRLTATVEK